MRVSLLALLAAGLLLLLAPTAAASSSSSSRAAFAGDLLEDMGLDAAEINQRAMAAYSGYSSPLHTPRLSLTASTSECADCVCGVGHHLLNESLNAVAAACTNVTCPFFKEKCAWLEKHPGELSGYLAVTVRPFTDGYMYCMGNASCEHPSSDLQSLTDALLAADTTAQPELLLPQLAAAARFIPQALRRKPDPQPPTDSTASAVADSAVRLLTEDARVGYKQLSTLARRIGAEERDEETSAEQHDGEDSPADAAAPSSPKKSKCSKCLRHSIKWQLRVATKALKAACAVTKCPHFQKFCEWSEKHPHVTRGMLYGHIKPWKAASGFCAGNKACRFDEEAERSEQAVPAVGQAPHIELAGQTNSMPPVAPAVAPAKPAHRPAFGRGKHDRVPHKKPHTKPNKKSDKKPHKKPHKKSRK